LNTAIDPDFVSRVRKSFQRQAVMSLIGASLVTVEPGAVDISLPFRSDLTQQNNFLHAAITTAIADSACGYAALSLTAPKSDVLTVEFKANLLRPGIGIFFLAEGRVLKPGKTITVARSDVFAQSLSGKTLIAIMTATLIRVDE
jgi:uncharacterized protein (TIGR00369 family)